MKKIGSVRDLVSEATRREGGKKQVSIAQGSEFAARLIDIMNERHGAVKVWERWKARRLSLAKRKASK